MKAYKTPFLDRLKRVDPCLLVCTTLLSAVSITLMYGIRDVYGTGMLEMQAAATGVGILVMLFISTMDYEEVVRRLAVPFFLIQIGVLALTLLFGTAQGENKSWLRVGPVLLQPSEFVKATFIVTFSKHLDLVKKKINHPLHLLGLAVHAGAVIGLIVLSGDLGVALVYCGMVLIMLYSAGLSGFYFLGGAAAVVLAVPYLWPHLREDQQKRIIFGFNPEGDPLDKGMQPLMGRQCVINGGLWGNGVNGGTQYKTLFACENDFVFSTLCEKLGAVGGIFVLILLSVLVVRIFVIARTARKDVGTYICVGVAAAIVVQTMENVGMSLAMLPVVGVTLPFISYGGSSTFAMYLLLGMVHSIRAHRVKYFFELEST